MSNGPKYGGEVPPEEAEHPEEKLSVPFSKGIANLGVLL